MDDPRVLHVDDEVPFCELVVEFLERHDLVVATEHSASDGLDRLEQADFDCVVSDYDMPGMDGLEFLDAVRERYDDLPFILFTGRGNEEVASEAISAGVSDYLQKDGAAEQYELLANRIHNYARQYRTRQQVETARRRYELAGTVSSDVIYEHDVESDETDYADWSADYLGYDQSEAGGWEWWLERVHPEGRDRVRERLVEATDRGETSVSLEYRLATADGEYRYLSEDRYIEYQDGDPSRVVGAFRDVTERRRREERLDALHEATRSLIAATTVAEVTTTTSDAAADILDLPINAVFLREGDLLRPKAYTDAAVDVLGEIPELPRGEAIMWDVYEAGEGESFGDVREGENVYNPETPIRSELYEPIDDYGVFVAASTTVEDFSQVDVHLAKVLTANAEAALERLDGE